MPRPQRASTGPREQPPINSACVRAIDRVATDRTLIRVRLASRHVFTISERDSESIKLVVGDALSDSQLDALRTAHEFVRARRWAMRWLNRTAVSRAVMQHRAVLKGYSQPVIARLLDELSQVGLINDAQLARTLAEGELMRKPTAAPLLLHKLARRGVDEDLAEQAASAALKGRDALQDAITLIEVKAQRGARAADPAALRRRLFGLLMRRGFDEETARRALDRTMGPAPDSFD